MINRKKQILNEKNIKEKNSESNKYVLAFLSVQDKYASALEKLRDQYMDRIGLEDVILIHKIDSAISSVYQSAFGEDIFKEDIDKISRIGLGIASNHGFVDGNKRTGLATIVALCKVNNIKLPNEDDLYNIIVEAIEDHESS